MRIKKGVPGAIFGVDGGEQKIATTGNPKPATCGNTRTELATEGAAAQTWIIGARTSGHNWLAGAFLCGGFLSGTVKKKLELPLTSEVGKDAVRR